MPGNLHILLASYTLKSKLVMSYDDLMSEAMNLNKTCRSLDGVMPKAEPSHSI